MPRPPTTRFWVILGITTTILAIILLSTGTAWLQRTTWFDIGTGRYKNQYHLGNYVYRTTIKTPQITEANQGISYVDLLQRYNATTDTHWIHIGRGYRGIELFGKHLEWHFIGYRNGKIPSDLTTYASLIRVKEIDNVPNLHDEVTSTLHTIRKLAIAEDTRALTDYIQQLNNEHHNNPQPNPN